MNQPPEFHFTIEPPTHRAVLRLGELWAYRELLFFFVWRDVKVRYKQTVFGAVWAVLQPFLTMLVFTVFFGFFLGVKSAGAPYPLFSFAALVPWTFFATSVTAAANSLVNNSNLLKKTYFPRLTLPVANVLERVVDFGFAFLVLLGMLLIYRVSPTANIIFLPLFLLLAFVTALGVGVWLATINVRYRDVKHIVPFLTQIWLYTTPVVYSSDIIPNPVLKTLYGLNPMVGVVEGFRWALLGLPHPPLATLAVSAVAALLILVSGLLYFYRTEPVFADVV